MNKRSIVFRADGDGKIGLGHLIRSSALAHMLKDDYECVLATRCTIEDLLDDLQTSFDQIVRLQEINLLDEARNFHTVVPDSDLVVLDGYHFKTHYQEQLVHNGFDLISVDDIHAFRFYSNIIINHSGGLTPADYESLPSTQYFLGPKYALLREPFLKAALERRNTVTDRNCMICFGGADPQNNTLKVIKELTSKQNNYFDFLHVIVGSAYYHFSQLNAFCKQHTNISLHHAVPPNEMIQIMRQCSYCICSPSTIVYEYLSVGGIVFLEQIADNQKDVIQYFTEEGMAFRIEDIGALADNDIKRAFEKAAQYFDGRSGERLKKVFSQYFASKNFSIRKAHPDDMKISFEWANDPNVRLQSYNREPIRWENHQEWFQKKMNDSNSYYYVFELNGQPVAQIRFQLSEGEAILGYLVDKSIRSKGLGTSILGKGIEALIKDFQASLRIVGYVKKSNVASQRSFEKLSFVKEETDVFPNSYKYSMSYGN